MSARASPACSSTGCKRKMRLQSDPTIIYGLFGGKGTPAGRSCAARSTQATPYNTYVIDGLPPGPIANPGRAALEAVANPSRTNDLYFVADGTGGHAFAETLEEHNRNVARWRQIEARAARARGKPTPDASPSTRSSRRTAPRTRTEASAPAAPGAPTSRRPSTSLATARPASTSRRIGCRRRGAGARAAAFDASEGTARDPLLNKTFDLNSPKQRAVAEQ